MLLWESLIVFVPALLKKISVIFYLESLCPVRVPFEGPGALFAIPVGAFAGLRRAARLLLLATFALVVVTAVRLRRIEIRYGTD